MARRPRPVESETPVARRRRPRRRRRTAQTEKPASRPPTSRAALIAGGVLACGAPLLIGGAPVWATETIAAGAVALVAALAFRGLPGGRDWGVLTVLGLWLYTVFQRVPLPLGVIELVAPRRMGEALETLVLVDGQPSWIPLSFDPGGTEVAILVGATVVAGWMLGDGLSVRYGRRAVFTLAGLSVAVTLVVSAVHWLAGSPLLYGVYAPHYQPLRPVAPLVNPNHFGAFLAFGAVVQAGLAVDEKERARTYAWGAASVAAATAAIATGSRGAVASLLAGFFLFGVLLLVRRRRVRLGRGVLLGALGAAALVGVLVVASADDTMAQLGQQDLSKLEMAWSAFPLALSHPFVGVGRGAFSGAFSAFEAGGRLTHPENILVQWAAEWGLPVALAALVALVAVLSRGFRRSRGASLAATAALLALGVHDLADFALELPAVALVAALVAGAVVRRRSPAAARDVRFVRATAGLLLVGVVGTIALEPGISWNRTHSLSHEAESWGDGLPEELTEAIQDHPLDAGLVLLAAWQAHRTQHPDAGRWLNRAMILAPDWAHPHHLAARALWNRGALAQAALELREAERRQPGLGRDTACEWVGAGQVATVLRAAPLEEELAVAFLEPITSCHGVPADALLALDARLIELAPERAGPQIRRARREDDVSAKMAILEGARGRATQTSDLGELAREISRVLLSADDLDGAVRALEEAPEEFRRDSPAWARDRLYLAILQDDEEVVGALRSRLRGQVLSNPTRLAGLHLLEARAFTQRGDLHLALAALESAQRSDPTGGTSMRIGAVAERLGMISRARTAYGQACRLDGAGSPACAASRRLGERSSGPRQPSP